MRHGDLEHRCPGHDPAHREIRLVGELHPLSRRRQGRAAELDHRRRLAVGDGEKARRRLQGRGQVLQLPVDAGDPDVLAHQHGLRTDHPGGVRDDQEIRLLRQEPRRRARCEAAHQQGAHRQLQGPALRQLCTGTRGDRGGDGGGVRGQEDREGGAGRRGAPRQRDPPQVRGCEQVTRSSRMEKRVVFRSAWLPYALVAPQIAITIVFFFLPAIQAGWYSFQLQDAFGERTQFVGLANFAALFRDSNYLHSFQVTAFFSAMVAGSGIAISLLLATMADRVIRGALVYRTLLIWPYAVASAVAGVLWLFLFAPSIGIITFALRSIGINWDWVLQGDQAMLLVVIAATWKQISYNFLFFLAGLQSIPKSLIEAAAIDGAGPGRRFWTIVFPLLSPTAFFLLVVNIVYAFFDTFGVIDATTQGGPAGATQILVYKVYYDGVKAADLGGSSAQSVILMVIVVALTVVQFRYIERKVQY